MAHELTATDHMVSAGNVTPWHGLGTVVADRLTAADALAAAKLDWLVTQEPVFDGDMKEIVTHQLNRRTDTREVLGIVAKGWQPVQNLKLLEVAESIAQVNGLAFKPLIETAGSLRGGRIVWALVQIGARSFADSEHRSYLLLSNGHDGTRAVRGTLTDVRVVCANTLRLAERADSTLYVSHARGVDARFKSALDTLGWANDATRATFVIYEALARTVVDVDKARGVFRRLVAGAVEIPTEGQTKAIDVMVELYRGGRGNAGRSAFDLVNAVTDWADHAKPYRSNDTTAERRFLSSSLGGDADKLKASAFKAARELAGV